jgi:competence protein ComEC
MTSKMRQGFIWISGGFLIGVILKNIFLATNYYFFILFFILSLAILFLGGLKNNKNYKIYLSVGLVLVGVFLGLWRTQIFINQSNKEFSFEINQKIELEGQIVEVPEVRDDYARLVISVEKNYPQILVLTNPYDNFSYGDFIKVSGKIERPENFINEETGRTFDYINYLKVQNIGYQISFAQVETINKPDIFQPGVMVKKYLFEIKDFFNSKINSLIKEPEASLLAGILTGDRRGLGQELEDKFRQVGLIHLVVLSGYNITIVASLIVILCSYWLSKRQALSISIIGICLFAIMVGAGPTVIRASIMAILALIARMTGRIYLASIGLYIAGIIMILWNPWVLLYDPGFQLSFLATAGLIYLAPILERISLFNYLSVWMREMVVTTISAQIAVLPLLLYLIGEFSVVALPINILVLPIIPVLMFVGFITGVVAIFSQWVAFIPATISYFILSYVLNLTNLFSQISFASIKIPEFNFVLVIILYLVLIGFIVKINKNQSQISTEKNISQI